MRIMIIRGSSGELNTDPGWAFQNVFLEMGIESHLVEHDSIVRNSRLTEVARVANQFARAYMGAWADSFSIARKADGNVLSKCAAIRPDLILVMKGMNVSRSLLRSLRELEPKAKIINFYTDNIFLVPKALEAASELDLLFLHDSYVLNKVRGLDITRVERMWHACDPEVQKPLNDISAEERDLFSCDLSLVGSIYPYRAILLEHLRGNDLKVWGKAWGFSDLGDLESTFVYESHQKSSLAGREKTLVYNLSKINLNTMQPLECIAGSNSRIHQVSASGGFTLHEEAPDLHMQYEVGREVITFNGAADLVEKVQHYLSAPDERQIISARARKKALEQHTYRHRAEEILSHFWSL